MFVACGDDGATGTPDAGVPVLFEPIDVLDDGVVAVDPADDPCAVLGPGCIPDGASFGVGAGVGDVDGDGRIDLYLGGANGGTLLLNRSSTGAVSFSPGATVNAVDYVHAAAFGDLDGDGDQDLALGTAAGLRLYENDGAGNFSEATVNLALTAERTTSIAIADLNADGRLDLHVCDYGVPGAASSTAGPGMLLINDGAWTFHDLATAWPGRHDWASAFADVDKDGRLDLMIASETWVEDDPDEQPSSLFYNNGADGAGDPLLSQSSSFEAALAQFTTPMAIAFGDVNADGELDVLVSVIGPLVYMGRADSDPRSWMAASFFGPSVEEAFTTAWAAALDDFDGDGSLDALVINGSPCTPDDCAPLMPTSQPVRLLRYADDNFEYLGERPVANAGGMHDESYRNGRGLVLADFDGDGLEELLVTPFNDRFRLYRRVYAGNTLRVALPRTAYGAEVAVTIGSTTRTRQLISGGRTHSQSEPALTFLLGDATTADNVVITYLDGSTDSLGPTPAGVIRP